MEDKSLHPTGPTPASTKPGSFISEATSVSPSSVLLLGPIKYSLQDSPLQGASGLTEGHTPLCRVEEESKS